MGGTVSRPSSRARSVLWIAGLLALFAVACSTGGTEVTATEALAEEPAAEPAEEPVDEPPPLQDDPPPVGTAECGGG